MLAQCPECGNDLRTQYTRAVDVNGALALKRRRLCDVCSFDTWTLEFMDSEEARQHFTRVKEGKNAKT
jgi:transcriptional regulator NrdR family protein